MSLGVQKEFFSASGAENQQEEEPAGEEQHEAGEEKIDHLQLLRDIYASHAQQGSSELRQKVVETVKPGNYEYLMRTLAFLANNDLIFDGQVTSKRFMTPLKQIKSPLTKEDVEYLAENLKLADVEIEKNEKNPHIKHKTVDIYFAPFMRTLLRGAPETE